MSEIDIDPIISLSSLDITKENKSKFSDQIQKVLDYMDVLNRVETNPNPLYEWPIHKTVTTREDNPQPFSHPLVEENAPDFSDDSFVVPKILSS